MTPYTLYDGTIYTAIGALNTLDKILSIAEKQPSSDAFIKARLIDDMKPLSFQINYSIHLGESMMERFKGERLPWNEEETHKDELNTYASYHERINHLIQQLRACDRDEINAAANLPASFTRSSGEKREVSTAVMTKNYHVTGFNFHVAMAYAILRKEGVPIGKYEWTSGFAFDYM